MAVAALDVTDLVRSDLHSSTIEQILQAPVSRLLGVNAGAATALGLLSINTVFDLGASETFAQAKNLYNASINPRNFMVQHGAPVADMVRGSVAGGVPVGELVGLPIAALAAVPEDKATDIANALDVDTIRDFANYPPHKAAVKILEKAYFPASQVSSATDKEELAYKDLVPTNDYPVEKTQYSVLIMDEIKNADDANSIDILSAAFGQLDLMRLLGEDQGFQNVAFGALMTFTHAWYTQGVGLGQLLHSVSLAPGESTRIALIDWSRKTSASQTESDTETSALANDTTQDRAINEVASATAQEAQGGFSDSTINSISRQAGSSSAQEISAPFGGLLGGPSFSFGQTSSAADSKTQADSYSLSWGDRNVAGSMLQKANDSTHQNAHSVRGKRASVVKEVSEAEKENISTRVLANYNHMHALNINYYELVQIYRTKITISQVDRVIFVPVKMFKFDDDLLIRRFKDVLARTAPSYEIAEALQNLDTVEIIPEPTLSLPAIGGLSFHTVFDPASISTLVNKGVFIARNPILLQSIKNSALTQQTASVLAASSATPSNSDAGESPPVTTTQSSALSVSPQFVMPSRSLLQQAVNTAIWDPMQTSKLASLLRFPIFLPRSSSFFLPNDVSIVDSAVSDSGSGLAQSFQLVNGSVVDTATADNPIPLNQLQRIVLKGGSNDKTIDAKVTLTLNRNGVLFPLDLPTVTIPKGANQETTIVTIKAGAVSTDLKSHLMQNMTLYNLAILKSLSATQIALLLSGYTIQVQNKVVPVAQVVEPMPIRYVGNFLAFKMNSSRDDKTWDDWLKFQNEPLGKATEDLVPLPCGGTFAEAVLGRSNCAEKLDITRFWNWQDSPIPLQPTDIAAIQSGSRAQDPGNLSPSQMGNPMINITNPSALPDPTGMAGVLQAIQNGNMFRDMSGLKATIAAAQAATQATQAGASTAGQQAGENMNNLLKADTERQRIAAQMISDLAKTAASVYGGKIGGGGSGGGAPSGSTSQDGAKINYFDKTAKPAGISGGSTQPSGSSTFTAAASPSDTANTIAGTAGDSLSGAGDSVQPEWSQNPAALAATWGDGAPPSSLFQNVVDKMTPATGVIGGENAWTLSKGAQSGSTRDPSSWTNFLFGGVPLFEEPVPRFSGTLAINGRSGIAFGRLTNGTLTNAIAFTAKPKSPDVVKAGRSQGWITFEFRQVAHVNAWQKVPVPGDAGAPVWKQFYSDADITPDGPDIDNTEFDKSTGNVTMYDSPGWWAPPSSTSGVKVGNAGPMSDPAAVEVCSKMLATCWVSGQQAPGGNWVPVSPIKSWCSITWIKKSSTTGQWVAASGFGVDWDNPATNFSTPPS